ncbi:MAG: hypothetical protein ACI870_000337 [Crocinitomicaceae bacterium]|jgi:hypothetical protein
MKKLFKGGAIALALMPFIIFAQQPQADAFSILDRIAVFVSRAVPVLIAIAFAYFLYGVVRFIMAQDADKKKDARSIVIQGIIGLFIMLSIWGLVGIIQRSIGTGSGGTLNQSDLPTINI